MATPGTHVNTWGGRHGGVRAGTAEGTRDTHPMRGAASCGCRSPEHPRGSTPIPISRIHTPLQGVPIGTEPPSPSRIPPPQKGAQKGHPHPEPRLEDAPQKDTPRNPPNPLTRGVPPCPGTPPARPAGDPPECTPGSAGSPSPGWKWSLNTSPPRKEQKDMAAPAAPARSAARPRPRHAHTAGHPLSLPSPGHPLSLPGPPPVPPSVPPPVPPLPPPPPPAEGAAGPVVPWGGSRYRGVPLRTPLHPPGTPGPAQPPRGSPDRG